MTDDYLINVTHLPPQWHYDRATRDEYCLDCGYPFDPYDKLVVCDSPPLADHTYCSHTCMHRAWRTAIHRAWRAATEGG